MYISAKEKRIMLKKILAVTMAVVMIFTAIPLVSAARRNIYPVVMVSGFGATIKHHGCVLVSFQ